MKTWIEAAPVSVPPELYDTIGGHPLVAATLVRRGVTTPEAARAFLDPDAYTPASPFDLPGMQAAVERLAHAIRCGERICVWGDFDVDGQTSTAILVSTLRALGAQVSFHIPVRARESHGVNLPVLERVIADGAQLILTCDTGVAAHEAVAYARAQGVDVVITDHHELPETLPEACAIVNPRLLHVAAGASISAAPPHPLVALPGAGVAYKLAEALFSVFQPADFHPMALWDLAALGIVADVAALHGEARYLVQRGLQALRRAERPGLRAIMEAAQVNATWLTEEHIGFALGPRLNALGRLSDANPAVELLTTDDAVQAHVLAAVLEGLNAQRQLLTAQIFQAAQAQIERDPTLLDAPVLVLADPYWAAGVIGIVASRLVECYDRPVVLLAAPSGELARGSARSIEGVNITAAIAAQKGVLTGFGGHPMAAGMSLPPENIPAFRRGLARSVAEQIDGHLPQGTLLVDAQLTLPELTLELVEDIGRLAPFGAGNPGLVLLIPNLALKSHSLIGRGGEHLQLIVADEAGNTQKVFWWQGAGWPLPAGRFDMACTLRASNYRGQREVQVTWVDFRPIGPVEIASPVRQFRLVDYRRQAAPLATLKPLVSGDVQIWAEAEAVGKLAEQGITALPREALLPSKALAIWTTPPGPLELQAVLERVKPEEIYLFGVDPQTGAADAFLSRLAGLVKFALNQRHGKASVAALAAATAQGEATVCKGLEWLSARGLIRVLSERDGALQISAGSDEAASTTVVRAQLEALLTECAAYRTYFRKADADGLRSTWMASMFS
ncbi:MAG: single-stranded-DNA-specific exonuclease RecJ [Chloroflexota bacterium]